MSNLVYLARFQSWQVVSSPLVGYEKLLTEVHIGAFTSQERLKKDVKGFLFNSGISILNWDSVSFDEYLSEENPEVTLKLRRVSGHNVDDTVQEFQVEVVNLIRMELNLSAW